MPIERTIKTIARIRCLMNIFYRIITDVWQALRVQVAGPLSDDSSEAWHRLTQLQEIRSLDLLVLHSGPEAVVPVELSRDPVRYCHSLSGEQTPRLIDQRRSCVY